MMTLATLFGAFFGTLGFFNFLIFCIEELLHISLG